MVTFGPLLSGILWEYVLFWLGSLCKSKLVCFEELTPRRTLGWLNYQWIFQWIFRSERTAWMMHPQAEVQLLMLGQPGR